MSHYEAWVSRGCSPGQPLLIYTEAIESVGHAIEFVAPEDASYVAVLLNDNSSRVMWPWQSGFHHRQPERAYERKL